MDWLSQCRKIRNTGYRRKAVVIFARIIMSISQLAREIAESSLEMLRSVPGLEDDAAATRLRDAAAVFVAEHGDLSELPAPEPAEAPAAEAAASMETEAAVEPSTVPEPQESEGEPAGASGAPEGSAPAEGGTGETGPADGGKNEDDGDQAGPATV